MVSAISSDTKYWFSMFVMHVCQIQSLHLHHTRIPCPKTAWVRQAVPSVTSGFGTGLWHVQQVSAGCVYTALLIDSLSLSQRNLAGQERQRCTFDCVHLVHIRIGVIRLSVGPVKSGWSFPQFWVYLTPSQAWGLSRVIGAVNLEEQRWYS